MNTLYYMDNLEALRMLPNESVDLIYADPPFNSNRNYGKIENTAFTDIWTWQEHGIVARDDITEHEHQSCTYSQLNLCMEAFDILLNYEDKGKQGAMRAYLSCMGVRLAEMHRVLKDTGSIYLQCDYSSGHYLKVLMDTVFSRDFFVNEIIWSYRWPSCAKKRFARRHDTILFYSKLKNYCFNKDAVRIPFTPEQYKEYKRDNKGYYLIHKKTGKKYYTHPKGQTAGSVFNIGIISRSGKERLDYPTQKPKALVERIIKASSNESHIVLDPFCGSGTTLDVCELLKRQWIGMDCGKQAIETTIQRLAEQHGMSPQQDYDLIGECDNIAIPEAKTLPPQQIELGI